MEMGAIIWLFFLEKKKNNLGPPLVALECRKNIFNHFPDKLQAILLLTQISKMHFKSLQMPPIFGDIKIAEFLYTMHFLIFLYK